jgi:hypothetical protein
VGKALSVNVGGVGTDYERAFRTGARKAMLQVGEDMADELDRQAPTPKVRFRVRPVRGDTVEVFSTHPGAKAMSAGAFIKPRKGKALKFRGESGETVFTRKPVRVKGTNYIPRALSRRRKIVTGAVSRALAPEIARAQQRAS